MIEDIEIGRAQPARPINRPAAAPVPPSEVLLLKKRNDKLRGEVADLRRAHAKSSVQKSNSVTRPHCGAKSMNSNTNDALRFRISELDTQLDAQRTQCIELEDALSASRELVKKMIRDDNST